MAINFRSNTIIKNLRVGPLSGGGNGGGGGGSSEPSYLAIGARGFNSDEGAVYVYDTSNYSSSPIKLSIGTSNDHRFGEYISISGNTLAISAWQNDASGTNSGILYLYDITNLSSSPTSLSAPSPSNFGYFGRGLDLDSSKLVVGEPNVNKVHVYDATNLSATPTTLTAPVISSLFGYKVKVTSNYLVIAAPYTNGSDGNVYVYNTSNLSASPTVLTSPNNSDNANYFGYSLDVSGNHLLIGARGEQAGTGSDFTGNVYLYDLSNLSASPVTLVNPDTTASAQFGFSVSLGDTHLVVGSISPNSAAYIYDLNNLSATPTKLTSGVSGDNFGRSVHAEGSSIVVGAMDDNGQRGKAYIYDSNNLSASPTVLAPSDLANNDSFGNSIALG